jgi:hypothetical protein
MRELAQEVVLDGPEVAEADRLAAHGLGDHAVVRVALAPRVPGRRHRDLVEQAEVERCHRLSLPNARSFTGVG